MHENTDESSNHINELLNLMQASCGGQQQSYLMKAGVWAATKTLTTFNNAWVRLEFWLQNNNIPEMADHAMVYLTEHPPVALLVGMFLLACGFPLLIFVVFAVLSSVLTLMGFIIVEGMILAVAGFILVSVLLGMVGTAAFIAAVIVGVYYSAMKLSRSFSSVVSSTPSTPQATQPDPFTGPRVRRLRRGSAFFGATSQTHAHDIFSLSHRVHPR